MHLNYLEILKKVLIWSEVTHLRKGGYTSAVHKMVKIIEELKCI